ncbi:hypothetical protein AAJ76_1680001746 [Vairimorpha ceranae]|uniref:Uncharacterized protein n=1 Tax=Vairimorpha ceranae TaxID=40302 RepID=A0A0F9WAI1_9MICR|nr:hypothetical protein AAJ76_1680001746 [Vairimorpha ceranae]KKO73935.1 hypothetical protein AAJ76_1680001746 [Vairimorpha ceranae]
MKSPMRKENGVRRDHIDNWLIQYTFKRRYVINKPSEEFYRVFVLFLKIFFKLNE